MGTGNATESTSVPRGKREELRQSFACVHAVTSVVSDWGPPGYSVHGDSPGKNTGVGCHALIQGIFPTQGSNLHLLGLLHWQVGSFVGHLFLRASLVAQLVKNLPAMQETLVQFLDQEDSLEKG